MLVVSLYFVVVVPCVDNDTCCSYLLVFSYMFINVLITLSNWNSMTLNATGNYKIKSNELGEDKNLERSVLWRKAREGKDGLYKTQEIRDVVEKLVSTMELKYLLFSY